MLPKPLFSILPSFSRMYTHIPSATDHAICHPQAAQDALKEAMGDTTSSTTSSTSTDVVPMGKKKGKHSSSSSSSSVLVEDKGEGEGLKGVVGLTALMEVRESV